MSEVISWTGKVAVTGVGMVTPVGLSAPAAAAAMRAGISRIGALLGFDIPNATGEMQPATGAEVPIVHGNRLGPARLLRLAEPAMREAVAQAGLTRSQRCGLFLGTATPHPAKRLLAHGPLLRDRLRENLATAVTCEHALLFEDGRASALQAIRAAAQELAREKTPLDALVVGGVDSLTSILTLSFLQKTGRLREGAKSTGILAGEGAAFLVLERPENATRRRAAILAFLEAAATGVDSTPYTKPTRAAVLGRVLRAVAPKVRTPAPLLVSDLNGERQRAIEWMFAACRAPFSSRPSLPHWRPSESIGDAGAASGGVTNAWAVAAFLEGYAGSPQAVIWGASDEGLRAAVVLSHPNGAN